MKRKLSVSVRAFAVSLLAALTTLGLIAQPAFAHGNGNIKENFNKLYLKPDPRADWWIINWGPDGSGGQGRVETYCGSASCITAEKDRGDQFARLSLKPSPQTAGIFTNADLAEIHSGFPSEGVGKWNPSPNHPVVLEAQIRWSNNYKQDGSGGAVGTNGIWLWNSPYNLEEYDPLATNTAIGLNWTPSNALGGLLGGLKVNVIDRNNPVSIAFPTRPVNMQRWVDFKMVWSKAQNGVQSVQFWINGEDLGKVALATPMENLSVESWNDNEDPQFGPNGELVINYAEIKQKSNFDINFINVTKK